MTGNAQAPVPPPRTGTTPPQKKGKGPSKAGKRWARALLLALAAALVLGGATLVGGWAGYRSGVLSQRALATQVAALSLQEQYDLALDDVVNGRLDVARQRLEYILSVDANYPAAAERLAEVMAVLYATATPTLPPATMTPTPTRDLRPAQERFAHAQELLAERRWDEGIDTLLSLRHSDPDFKTARVDGMFYLALRQRGVDKIWRQGNLEGGIYDLALASRFGPLDAQAVAARDLARLYLFGSSFWEVYPERAVYYFSQVAAAAPGLRDASGWTAAARYREALIQYGDQLMGKRDWCNAQAQYELALSMGVDEALQQKRQQAALLCSPPTNTPAPSATPSPTETLPVFTPATPTPTLLLPPTATNTAPAPPTNTPPPPPTDTPPPPPPTDTPPPPPTDTPSSG